MSFMFNPYPYDDPNAINHISLESDLRSSITYGKVNAAKRLAEELAALTKVKGNCIVGIDGYLSAPLPGFAQQLSIQLAALGVLPELQPTAGLLLDDETLHQKLLPYLPEDRENDPVLLYGSLYDQDFQSLMCPDAIAALEQKLADFAAKGKGVLVLWGHGALLDNFRRFCDKKVYLDMTQKRTILNVRSGDCTNLGCTRSMPVNQIIRRSYYVDFEIAMHLRGRLICEDLLDYYIAADRPEELQMIPLATLKTLFLRMTEYPLRCRPVYIEGVWGGFYVKHLRNLPAEMKNCAWVFDLIPMEVSIVAALEDEHQLEFPFYCFVQTVGKKLIGEKGHKKFHGYFPIRFNYDDTYHASGNMSIQVHPDADFVKGNNELGRQDESYYMVVTGQEAKTYCGFRQEADVEDFVAKTRLAESKGIGFNHDDYVYAEPSVAGQQFLIPAGTIHASGRNQVILEIGSLTIGSYTYKMYDYMRKDLEGNLRPIHTNYGDKVLRRDFKEDWVKGNLIQKPRVIRTGEGFSEMIVGEHDLIYFSLRHLRFTTEYTDVTTDRFHVLVLVEGEQCLICSETDPSRSFTQNYLDMVIIPADFGPYRVINKGVGTVTMHKTLLKDGFENE